MRSLRFGFTALLFAMSLGIVAFPASGASVERAAIIPLTNAFVGPAVNSGAGYSMYANGISDYWSTASSATVSIAIFVYPGRQVTQDIEFKMMPPDGANPVYAYTFKNQTINVVGSWYTVGAVGDYSKAGVYNAIVTANGEEIGRIPIVFTAPPSTR